MKTRIIQTRLSEAEYKTLSQEVSQSGMTLSDYLRSLIGKKCVYIVAHDREIMQRVCEIYRLINPSELECYDLVMKELNEICQLLRY